MGAAVALVAAFAPLTGWPAVVRLPAVLVPAVLLAVIIVRPWRMSAAQWETLAQWAPSRRIVWCGSIAAGGLLCWIVLTRFYSGQINAVDFTVYFDRPCFQAMHARSLWIETTDFPEYSRQSLFQHHAYWAMFPVCALYAIYPTPFWLLLLSVVAVVAGAVYVFRILHQMGTPGIVATAAALAYVLNDNTARTLQYGFHPEVLFAWSIPWLIHAGITGRQRQFACAVLATVLVKESAVLHLTAAVVALGLYARPAKRPAERTLWLMLPVALGVVNLLVYYAIVVPALSDAGLPAYSGFWGAPDASPLRALPALAANPVRIAVQTIQSGFFTTVLPPLGLLLPLVGWRWTIGITPIVCLFSASVDAQVRAFGIYYSIALVPFLTLGAATGALQLGRRLIGGHRGVLAAAAALVGTALVVGSSDRGYTLRPWRADTAAVHHALSRLEGAPHVLVQSALYPHAGYSERIHLLADWTLAAPEYRDAVVLLAPELGAYPLSKDDVDRLIHRGSVVAVLPHGLVAVRARN